MRGLGLFVQTLPGAPACEFPRDEASRALLRGLRELGIIDGKLRAAYTGNGREKEANRRCVNSLFTRMTRTQSLPK